MTIAIHNCIFLGPGYLKRKEIKQKIIDDGCPIAARLGNHNLELIAWVHEYELDEDDKSLLSSNGWKIQDIGEYASLNQDFFCSDDSKILESHLLRQNMPSLFKKEEPNYGAQSDILRLLILRSQSLQDMEATYSLYTDNDERITANSQNTKELFQKGRNGLSGSQGGNSILCTNNYAEQLTNMIKQIIDRLNLGYAKTKIDVSELFYTERVEYHGSFKRWYTIWSTGPENYTKSFINRVWFMNCNSVGSWFTKKPLEKGKEELKHLKELSQEDIINMIYGSIHYELIILKTEVYNPNKYIYYLWKIDQLFKGGNSDIDRYVATISAAWDRFKGSHQTEAEQALQVPIELSKLSTAGDQKWSEHKYQKVPTIVINEDYPSIYPEENKPQHELPNIDEPQLKQNIIDEYKAWQICKWVKYNGCIKLTPEEAEIIKSLFAITYDSRQKQMYINKYKIRIIKYLFIHQRFELLKEIFENGTNLPEISDLAPQDYYDLPSTIRQILLKAYSYTHPVLYENKNYIFNLLLANAKYAEVIKLVLQNSRDEILNLENVTKLIRKAGSGKLGETFKSNIKELDAPLGQDQFDALIEPEQSLGLGS